MNEHEIEFVNAFVPKIRRERILAMLTVPKLRHKFRFELHHPKSSLLIPEYIRSIAPSQQTPTLILQALKKAGAPDRCWAIGNQFDATFVNLDDALHDVVGAQMGTILSCIPGRLAYFESEEDRVILSKPV